LRFRESFHLSSKKKIAANLRRAFSLTTTLKDFLQVELANLNAGNHKIAQFLYSNINKKRLNDIK
jgi:hypothetical protein